MTRPRRARPLRTVAVAVGLSALGLGLGACSTSDVISTGSSAALEVDGRTVLTRDQLQAELRRYGSNPDYMLGKADPVAPDATRFPAALTVDRLNHHLRLELMAAVLERLKLQPAEESDAIRNEAIQNIFSSAGEAEGKAAFAKLPESDRNDYVMLGRQIAAVRAWIDPEITKAKAALGKPEDYYAKHRDEFQEACVRHVLVASQDEALKVKARLQGGEDWKTVALVSTDPGSAQAGGELPCGPVDQYVPPFAVAARELDLNELSDPIQTQFGFHILQVTKRSNAAFNAAAVSTRIDNVAGEQTLKKIFQPMEDLKVKVPVEYGTYRSGAFTDFPAIVAPGTALASAP